MLMNRVIKTIRVGDRGLNYWSAVQDMKTGEAYNAQNCYWRDGIIQRLGSVKHSTTEVTASKAIVGLHRFYHTVTGRSLIAVAGTVSRYMNDGTGAWTNIRTGLTDSTQTHMVTWGALNKAYFANGVDAPTIITSALANAAFAAPPADSKMFLPYRDRLLGIYVTDPSYIRWSGSYDDTTWTTAAQAIRVPGSGGIEVIAPHTLSDVSSGISGMIFVAKPTSVYLFSVTNLDPTSAGFDVRLDAVGGGEYVGCISPRTVVSTPKGTIFLGNDRQVYILPIGSFNIVPIGHKIRSNNTLQTGIEAIPVAKISQAAAIYHNGFYKLSFTPSGGSLNTQQFWLDIDRLYQDENGHFGPWYGPMTGMTIGMFVNQAGSGDDGRLIGGEQDANGFVYRMNEAGTYADNTASQTMIFQSAYEPYADAALDSRITQTEIEMLTIVGSANLSFYDTTGSISGATAFGGSQSNTYYAEAYWGEFYWNGSGYPVREKIQHYHENIIGRQISTRIEYTSSTDSFKCYSIKHECKHVRQVFQTRA